MLPVKLIISVPFLALGLNSCVVGVQDNAVNHQFTTDHPALTSDIYRGATVGSAPGVEAGVFLEYLGDGEWHVFATCDTKTSGRECHWDVLMEPGGSKTYAYKGDELEGSDSLSSHDRIRLLARNSDGYDGLFIDAESGVPLRIDVMLNGDRRPDLIFWIGRRGLREGTPESPIDLIPIAK